MVTQYIGARYVPLFYTASDNSNNWEAGVQYDPLTIVTDLNQSYTSKIPVPASVGRPSENPQYWILTGAYNSQIEQYRQEVETLSGTVETISGEVTANSEAIEDIEKSLTKKYLIITDSYADANRGGYAHGWVTAFGDIIGATYGTDIYLYQKGGAGFCGNGQGKTFGDLLSDAIGALSADVKNSITDIIVAGGCNDVSFTFSEINTAKDAFTTAALAAFPNAVLTLAVIGGFMSAIANRAALYQSVKFIYDYAYGRRIHYIVNAHVPMELASSFDADNIHPNTNGCGRIGKAIATAFMANSMNGLVDTKADRSNLPVTLASGVGGSFVLKTNITDGCICIQSLMQQNLSGSFTFAYNTGGSVFIGTLGANNIDMIVPNTTAHNENPPIAAIPVVAEAFKTSSETYTIAGDLRLVWDGSTSKINVYFHSDTAPAQIEGATWLRIKPFTCMLNYI